MSSQKAPKGISQELYDLLSNYGEGPAPYIGPTREHEFAQFGTSVKSKKPKVETEDELAARLKTDFAKFLGTRKGKPYVEVSEEEEEDEWMGDFAIIRTGGKEEEEEKLNIDQAQDAETAFKATTGPITKTPTGPVTKSGDEQGQSKNTMTDLMLIQQKLLSEIKKNLEQNNYLKLMELKANQNVLMNVNPTITQDADRTRFQRRVLETQKLKVEQFERASSSGIIRQEQQFLQQQQYANYHWGIPNVQGIVYAGDEFFTA